MRTHTTVHSIMVRRLHPFLCVVLLVACSDRERGDGVPALRTDGAPVTPTNMTPVIREAAAAQAPSENAFQEATRAVLPAVVYIQVEARPRQMFVPFGPFGLQPPPSSSELQPAGSGSGVLFAEGGYILTNNHVVQEAERVTVTLYDRRQFEAQVVARDPSTDIAVVRIRGK